MPAEGILKIAGDTRKTFLEEARTRFGSFSRPNEKRVEVSEVLEATKIAEEAIAVPENVANIKETQEVPVAEATKVIAPEAVVTSIAIPVAEKVVVDEKAKNKENAERRLAEKEKKEAEDKVKAETILEAEKKAEKTGDNSGNVEKKEDPIEDAIKIARQQYARTEFRDHEKLKELEKESGFKLFKVGKKYEETPNTRTTREAYEKVLKLKMEKELAEIEARNINGEYDEKKLQSELKEAFTYYNVKAAHDLYNARTEELIAFKKEDSPDKSSLRKGWDKVSLGMTSIAHAYNTKVPLWVKGAMLAGGIATGTGLVAASTGTVVFSSTKRIWGAIMMATTGGMQLDAAAQFMDKWQSGKAGSKNIKEVTTEDGKIDFEKFKTILDGKIGSVNEKLDKYVKRSKRNKYIAAGMAAVFGTMAFSGIAHALQSGGVGAEHVTANVSDAKGTAAKLPPIPKSGVFADGSAHGVSKSFNVNDVNPKDGGMPASAAFEHQKGAPANFAEKGQLHTPANIKEALHTPAASETLTIEKGSSIEKTLIDHIKKTHPGMKNPGQAAHRMWLDYMHDNKEQLIAKVGDNEYAKMLKDGMVNVKPGTTLLIDEHNPLKFELKDIGGKISHLNGHHSVGGSIVENGQGNGGALPVDMPKPSAAAVAGNTDAVGHAAETKQHITTGQEMFKSANADYIQATNYDQLHSTVGDGPSMAQYEAMGAADKARDAAISTVENAAHAKELYFKSIKDAANTIYKTTGYKWDDIKDLDYSSAYADEKLNPIIKQTVKEFKKEFGDKNLPNSNASFGKWLYRVKEISIKKRLGIFAE